jgi:mannan endo-1,4-beta-mannosidase
VPDELNGRPLNWDELRDMVARFYVCAECKASYLKHVRFVMERTNKVTGRKYIVDPTIMAWELANEPRPMRPGARERYAEWIRDAAAAIKARDKNHLVTIGHEGSIGTEGMDLFEEVHRDPNIDYLTIHIWAKNWAWFEPGKMREQFPAVVSKATAYIDEHVAVALRLNKPLVIEEFGLPRDEMVRDAGTDALGDKKGRKGEGEKGRPGEDGIIQNPTSRIQNLTPGSATSLRDEYFRKIFSYVGKGPVAGANFWAFGGTARPRKGQVFWKAGDEWMGDPPMEEQGLNSVFDVDRSTWKVIKSASRSVRR